MYTDTGAAKMISQIALTPIIGLPLLAWGGMITFILLIATAFAGYRQMPINVHRTLAITTLLLVIIHGIAGLSIYLGW
jgi:hypothetical protein